MENINDIVEALASENGLPKNQVIEAIKESMVKMAKKEIDEEANFVVLEDKDNNDFRLVQKMIVCNDVDFNDSMSATHVTLSQASALVHNVSVGDTLEYQINLESMNRNAVNGIFHDISMQLQRLNEREILKKLEKDINKIVIAIVVHISDRGDVAVEINDTRATMPLKNRIKGESFKIGQPIRCILKSAKITKHGLKIEVSRTTPLMLEELLKLEVPEIKDGDVIIHKIARIPGERAKVSVYANNPKIDPIGATVGAKGVRINAISKELNGESIDCVEYSNIPEIFISKALLPAQVLSVKIDKSQDLERPKAIVQIGKSQKSKAIGRSGINIRLASMITGYDFQLDEIEEKQSSEAQQSAKSGEAKEKKLGLEALESLFKGG